MIMIHISPILLALLVSAVSCFRVFAFVGNLYSLHERPGSARRQRHQRQHLKPFSSLAQTQHIAASCARGYNPYGTCGRAACASGAATPEKPYSKTRRTLSPLALGRKHLTQLGAAASKEGIDAAEGGDSTAAELTAAVTDPSTEVAPAGDRAAGETSATVAGSVDLAKGIAFEAPKTKREEVKAEEASKKVGSCV